MALRRTIQIAAKLSMLSLGAAMISLPALVHAQTATDPNTDSAPVAHAPAELPPPPPGQTGNMPPPPPGYAPQQGQPMQPQYGQPYPQQGYAPQGYYPQQPPQMMLRRRVVEYHGGPIPPGAVLETQRMKGLIIGGAIAFLGAYLSAIVWAADSGGSGLACTASSCGNLWLLFPIAGPWITLTNPGHTSSSGDVPLLVIDGVLQGLGVVAAVIGLIHTTQVLVVNEYGHREHTQRPQWALLPGAPGTPAGLTLAVTRF